MSHTNAQTLVAYEEMAHTYAPEAEHQSAWNSLYERPAMIGMLPDVRGKRVLDVGCGTGPISAWVASHGAEAVGSFHYLHDWAPPLGELRRVLQPDGLLLISTHHPVRDIELSATGNYFETELVHDRWARGSDRKEFDVHFWRRPLSAMFEAFDEAGFAVRTFLEPLPVEECRERFPDEWVRLTTKPVFVLFKLVVH